MTPTRVPVEFSVVIPTYNSGPYLRIALESVLAQTTPPAEIIVIDDGSTDDSPAVARSFGPRVQVHCQANRGQGAARNVAMKLAKSDWIALLDHDDVWEPEKLEVQAAAIRDNPDAVVIYTDSKYIEDDQIIGTLPAPDSSRLPKVLRRLSPFAPSSVVLRREVVLAEGGFSEVKGMLEDWDLWLRLIPRHKFVHVAQSLTRFRKSRTQVTSQAEKFLNVHMMCVDRTLLKDVPPPIRWFRRARLYSCFLADCSIMLREQGNRDALPWMFRSMAWWPIPTTWNDRRYKVFANMLWKRAVGSDGRNPA